MKESDHTTLVNRAGIKEERHSPVPTCKAPCDMPQCEQTAVHGGSPKASDVVKRSTLIKPVTNLHTTGRRGRGEAAGAR